MNDLQDLQDEIL